MSSFPITQQGDTVNFIQKQERASNTVIVRTEDFHGFRVRQEIYPDIDAFRAEQWPMSASDFNDFGLSRESANAKTGVKYLFDGELKGLERLIASAYEDKDSRQGTEIYGAYLAGPYSYEKPIILDLREPKTPGRIRIYCLYPCMQIMPLVWLLGETCGSVLTKIKCRVKCRCMVTAHLQIRMTRDGCI